LRRCFRRQWRPLLLLLSLSSSLVTLLLSSPLSTSLSLLLAAPKPGSWVLTGAACSSTPPTRLL
jgi:hypothetical protein